MSDECQYCLGWEDSVKKRQAELSQLQDKLNLSQKEYKQLCHKLEKSDKIVSKLRSCVEFYSENNFDGTFPIGEADTTKKAQQCLKEINDGDSTA